MRTNVYDYDNLTDWTLANLASLIDEDKPVELTTGKEWAEAILQLIQQENKADATGAITAPENPVRGIESLWGTSTPTESETGYERFKFELNSLLAEYRKNKVSISPKLEKELGQLSLTDPLLLSASSKEKVLRWGTLASLEQIAGEINIAEHFGGGWDNPYQDY